MARQLADFVLVPLATGARFGAPHRRKHTEARHHSAPFSRWISAAASRECERALFLVLFQLADYLRLARQPLLRRRRRPRRDLPFRAADNPQNRQTEKAIRGMNCERNGRTRRAKADGRDLARERKSGGLLLLKNNCFRLCRPSERPRSLSRFGRPPRWARRLVTLRGFAETIIVIIIIIIPAAVVV